MTFAYNYNDGWRKFPKENFLNLLKSQKLRTLNLAKFSRYTVRGQVRGAGGGTVEDRGQNFWVTNFVIYSRLKEYVILREVIVLYETSTSKHKELKGETQTKLLGPILTITT